MNSFQLQLRIRGAIGRFSCAAGPVAAKRFGEASGTSQPLFIPRTKCRADKLARGGWEVCGPNASWMKLEK